MVRFAWLASLRAAGAALTSSSALASKCGVQSGAQAWLADGAAQSWFRQGRLPRLAAVAGVPSEQSSCQAVSQRLPAADQHCGAALQPDRLVPAWRGSAAWSLAQPSTFKFYLGGIPERRWLHTSTAPTQQEGGSDGSNSIGNGAFEKATAPTQQEGGSDGSNSIGNGAFEKAIAARAVQQAQSDTRWLLLQANQVLQVCCTQTETWLVPPTAAGGARSQGLATTDPR